MGVGGKRPAHRTDAILEARVCARELCRGADLDDQPAVLRTGGHLDVSPAGASRSASATTKYGAFAVATAAPNPTFHQAIYVPTGGVLATGFANAANAADKAVVPGTTNENAVIRPARR